MWEKGVYVNRFASDAICLSPLPSPPRGEGSSSSNLISTRQCGQCWQLTGEWPVQCALESVRTERQKQAHNDAKFVNSAKKINAYKQNLSSTDSDIIETKGQ